MTTSLTSELLEATRFVPERDLQHRLRTRFGLDNAYQQIPDAVRAEHEDFLARLRVSHVHVTQRTAHRRAEEVGLRGAAPYPQ